MVREVNKTLYTIFLISIKYIPILLALGDCMHSIFSYYDINAACISYLSGISILSLLFIYAASFTFGFCSSHRVPLHYVVISNSIALYDSWIGIPISDKQMLCTYLIVFGISIFIYLYCRYVEHNKNIITKIHR